MASPPTTVLDDAPLRPDEIPEEAPSAALQGYLDAFSGDSQAQPFITFYSSQKDKGLSQTQLTRAQFWRLASRAARLLKDELGVSMGDAHMHFFSGNTVEDLALRLAAVLLGSVPVTVNWDSDTLDRIIYKARCSSAKVVFVHSKTPAEHLQGLRSALPGLNVVEVERLWDASLQGLPPADIEKGVGHESTRIIIYTSGSSGEPKGVRLPYRSYITNRQTFESFLLIDETSVFRPVIVNPMHHTNSTAFTDWALRRPGTHLHLFERYTTGYWGVLASLATSLPVDRLANIEVKEVAELVQQQSKLRLIAPTVSRHFDFLESLVTEGKLPVTPAVFQAISPVLNFIIGSAPVGPNTVTRLQKYVGRLPTIRFGSTETCLQVMGIPLTLPEQAQLEAFRKGWEAPDQPGFYVGRGHPPFVEVKVVKSLDKNDTERYLQETEEGERGYLVTRGRNLMSGYVHNEDATKEAIDEEAGGWYKNLGDIAFWRRSSHDGEKDFYWVSRTSNLLIKGGSNYSYDQISDELAKFLAKHFSLPQGSFAVAAVGRRVSSEHDDDCLVMVELLEPEAKGKEEEIVKEFIKEARRAVSKGAKPDRLAIGSIPRNFKGDINWRQLESTWDGWLKQQAKTA